jgi:hypothetical protein
MIRPRVSVATILLPLFLGVSCRGERKPAPSDSAVVVAPSAVLPVPPVVNPGWNETAAGPVMLLAAGDLTTRASIVLPSVTDSTLSTASAFELDSLSSLPVDLFDRSGSAGSAILDIDHEAPVTENCPSWPVGTLKSVSRHWRVGFRSERVKALPLDSLEGATPADSLATTTELARLASALPATGDPVFRGLPFAVRKAYRTNIGATTVLIGDVARTINEEANPREEHLLLIAEAPSGASSGYVTAFHSRVTGSEEIVRTSEILAAVQFVQGRTPAILVSFDYEDGGRVVLIERVGGASWKIKWQSAYTGC